MAAALLSACAGPGEDYHTEGMKLYSEGKYSQAQELLAQAVAADNGKALYYVDLGMNCIQTADYKQAKDNFDRALIIGGEDELAYRGLGIMALDQELWADAVSYFTQAVDAIDMEVGPLEVDILKYKAYAHKKAGEYDEALGAYKALIELGDDRVENTFAQGDVCLLMGKEEEARTYFDEVIKLSNDVSYYIAIYNSYSARKLYAQGAGYLNKALVVEGSSDDAHLNRGMIYYIMGNYENAVTEFSYPYESADADKAAKAAMYTALCREKQKLYSEAISAYVYSLKKKDDPQVNNYYAMCLARTGEYNLAWNVIHTAIETYPDCECMQDMMWNEIVLYEKMEMFPSAYTRLTEYLKIYPGDAVTEKEMAFLKLKMGTA